MNTCLQLGASYKTIVLYSHLIPVSIALLLGIFVLVKSKFSFLANLFFLFIFGFSLWLIGDIPLWGAFGTYNLVTSIWSSMDLINIIFYLFGAYFFAVLVRNKDITIWEKIIFLAAALPAVWITYTGNSIADFYQPFCEATNNEWLTNYKLYTEVAVIAYIMIVTGIHLVRGKSSDRKQIVVVSLALIIFLTIFASTEYIASITGVYEINLYSLFVLPIFLALIIFSITNLRIFAYKSFGMQLLIYILLILVGSQFFFLESVTNKLLTILTFILSLFLGLVLARNIRKEEQMAVQLQIANEGQETLIHFMNHQIKGYLSKARSIFAELETDEEYGPFKPEALGMLKEGDSSLKEGIEFVQDILKASNIEKGTMAYNMESLDFKEIVNEMAEDQRKGAEAKRLKYSISIESGDYELRGDKNQLKEAVRNLINNSINYTPSGSIDINLVKIENKVHFTVKDTGVGLSEAVKPKLFTKGGRDKNSQSINVNSTGFGLSIVKGIVDAHHGRVWAESEGPGKGSTFTMELPIA